MGTPPLGLMLSQRGAWQAQVVRRQQQGGGAISSWWILLDRRLARAIDQAGQPGWRRRSNLWIAGNATNGKLALACCLVVFVMMGAGSLVPELWKGMDFEFADFVTNPQGPPFAMLPLTFPDLCFACLGLIWRGRRRLLAVESLRPVSRRQLGAGNDDRVRLGLCADGVFLRRRRGGTDLSGRPAELDPPLDRLARGVSGRSYGFGLRGHFLAEYDPAGLGCCTCRLRDRLCIFVCRSRQRFAVHAGAGHK